MSIVSSNEMLVNKELTSKLVISRLLFWIRIFSANEKESLNVIPLSVI